MSGLSFFRVGKEDGEKKLKKSAKEKENMEEMEVPGNEFHGEDDDFVTLQ